MKYTPNLKQLPTAAVLSVVAATSVNGATIPNTAIERPDEAPHIVNMYKIGYKNTETGERFLPETSILETPRYRDPISGPEECVDNYPMAHPANSGDLSLGHNLKLEEVLPTAVPVDSNGESFPYKVIGVPISGGEVLEPIKIYSTNGEINDENLGTVDITHYEDSLDLYAYAADPEAFNPFIGKGRKGGGLEEILANPLEEDTTDGNSSQVYALNTLKKPTTKSIKISYGDFFPKNINWDFYGSTRRNDTSNEVVNMNHPATNFPQVHIPPGNTPGGGKTPITPPAPIPLPPALPLLGVVLGGLALSRRKKK